MNKLRLSTFITLFCSLSLVGCKDKNEPSQKINNTPIPSNATLQKDYFAIEQLNLNMVVGETTKLDIDSIPVYATSDINFVSKNPAVASVDAQGNVTGVAKGKTEIEVATKDGQAKETLFVSVNEEIALATGAAKLQEKGAVISDPGYQKCSKLKAHEYVRQAMYRNGKVFNESRYVEDIIFSKEDAYFKVTSDDIQVRTADGSASVSSGTWIFYVETDSYDTYLLHETPTTKNYMEVHTQKYLGRPAYTIIYDILNMFFVSGSEIVTDYLDDADGVGLFDNDEAIFTSCALTEYDNAKEKVYSPNGEDLWCSLTLTNNDQVISAKEEFSIEIPAGTVHDDVDQYDIFIDGYDLKGFNITANMEFEMDGDPHKRVFTKNVQYIRDFEIEIPDLNDYGLVDSIYDL